LPLTCHDAVSFLSAIWTIFGVITIDLVKLVAQCTGLICISFNNNFDNISIDKGTVIDFRVSAHGFTFFQFDFGYNKTRGHSFKLP
jgi:hypothetical protein